MWHTQRLKDYLVQDYAINEKRLAQKQQEVQRVKTGIRILSRTIEEESAMLLYLIIKNHPFVDGNKRIAAACFLLFLQRNGILKNQSGEPIISNEALASLKLFVAAGKPEEMEM